MQPQIDGYFADRLSNTPKRMRQAAEARNEGTKLSRAQKFLRLLADAHDRRACPAELANIKTRAQALELTRTRWEHKGGYYDASTDTGVPYIDNRETKAVWAMLDPRSPEQAAAEELRRRIDGLQFSDIPGYFPTPAPVIAQMFDLAEIPDDRSVMILEPEAGSGAILDAIKDEYPLARTMAFERHCTLAEILRLKGYELLGGDFIATPSIDWLRRFDFVLMNPPFEKGQDMEHVRKAFTMLAPGGTLVSVMSPAPFFHSSKAALSFRTWFHENGGEKVELPAGAFKASGTQVATVLIKLSARC